MLRAKQQLSLNFPPKGRTSEPQQNVPGYFKKACITYKVDIGKCKDIHLNVVFILFHV